MWRSETKTITDFIRPELHQQSKAAPSKMYTRKGPWKLPLEWTGWGSRPPPFWPQDPCFWFTFFKWVRGHVRRVFFGSTDWKYPPNLFDSVITKIKNVGICTQCVYTYWWVIYSNVLIHTLKQTERIKNKVPLFDSCSSIIFLHPLLWRLLR